MLPGSGRNRSRSRRRNEHDNNDDGGPDNLMLHSTSSFVDEDNKEEDPYHHLNHHHNLEGDDTTQYSACDGPDNALIYSAPTLDTLGDESSLIRPYPQPAREEQPRQSQPVSYSLSHPSSTTSREATPLRGSLSAATNSTPPRTPERTISKQLQQQQQQPPQSASRSGSRGRRRESPILHRSTVPPSPLRTRKTAPSSSTTPTTNPNSTTSSTSHVNTKHGSGTGGGISMGALLGSSLLSATKNKNKVAATATTNTLKKKTKFRKSESDKEFQHDKDSMYVSVRTIPVAERVAFDKHRLLSVEEWQAIAMASSQQLQGVDAVSSPTLFRKAKLSPSLQQLQLLHKMQSISHVRQLAFSPSMGLAADALFVSSNTNDDCYDSMTSHSTTATASAATTSTSGQPMTKLRRSETSTTKRDGRYRSIDPVQATVAALPPTPPLLSNKKHRLPLRSDVGFPNASMEEIQQKHAEINHETEWEEASPRLIVLVTSDDLGTAVQEEPKRGGRGIPLNELTKPWNGGGLEGMPWAGPELQLAKARNHRHFAGNSEKKKNSVQSEDGTHSSTYNTDEDLKRNGPPSLNQNHRRTSRDGSMSTSTNRVSNRNQQGNRKRPVPPPNRYSMLAPPLDAAFSNTFGWHPRPFHDRQPCMAYALACPVRIDFDAGNLEPLLCSLTLYSLPAASSSSSSSTTRTPFGKASEDFWFPAGDWKGRVDVQSLASAKYQKGSSSGDPERLLDSWHQRTHKAIFSYQSHDYGNGRDHQRLHVVLQVYKVTHVDSAAAYMANVATGNIKNNSSGTPSPKHHATLKLRLQSKFKKRGVEKSDLVLDADIAAHRTNYRANVVYDNFGTQFMTPLCFGVTELFPSTREGKMTFEGAVPETAKWPQGEVQSMQLYAYPNHSESQEDFCERITKIANGVNPKFTENTMEESLGALYTMQGDDRSWAATSQTYSSISSLSSNASVGSASANGYDLPSPSSKKGRGVLRFMSPRRPSSKKDAVSHPQQTQNQQPQMPDAQAITLPMAAKARLFTSALDVDFLQSLLFSQPDMENRSENGNVTSRRKNKPQPLAKVFVDVSGDSAIMVDPRKEATSAAASGEEASAGLTEAEKTPSSGDVQGLPTRKRSSLIRLPALSNKPAGYSDAAEFREVLFLPPRLEKNFDSVDVTPSYRSLLNLLYLYPRLLRLADSQGISSDQCSSSTFNRHGVGSDKDQKGAHNGKATRYCIRIRLIQSSTGIDHETGMVEAVNKALDLFHNPAPWTGPPLLNVVYTRIRGDASGAGPAPTSSKHNGKHDGYSHGGGDDIKKGIPMKDEFKLRLPMVLDGSYFLNFALFSVSVHDDLGDDSTSGGGNSSKGGNKSEAGDGGCGVSLHSLAETTIPLSSSTRDSVSGIKATTIIPNGIHRLRLGEFQLQLESRLVSSIHVSDPAVATALRDFPLVASDVLDGTTSSAGCDDIRELVLVTRQTSSSSRGVKTTPIPEKVPYASLFANASGSALIAHFQEFFYMHLSNLIGWRSANIEVSGKFLFDNIQSLLEICRRIKLSIRTSSDRQEGVDRLRLNAFIKGSIDAFDEDLLHVGASSRQAAANSEDDAASEAPESRSSANEPDDSAEEDLHLDFDGGAVRRRHKSSIRSGIDLRISRTFSAMESTVIPFSRVAYGASKADRMRLEAELDHDNGRFSYLVDDDETVVTTATGRFSVNEATMADARDAFAEKIKWVTTPKEQGGGNVGELDSVNANKKSEGDGGGGVGAPPSSHLPDLRDWRSYSKTLGELGLAKRVQYAAHVMLSPCVAPNVSTLFSPRSDNSQPYPTAKSQLEKEALRSTPQIARKSSIVEAGSNRISCISASCSEVDDKEYTVEDDRDDNHSEAESAYRTTLGTFRSPSHCPVLSFTIQSDRNPQRLQVPLARGEFVYESILVLWLRAWVDHAESKNRERAQRVADADHPYPTFIIPEFDMESPIEDPIYSFFAHMDIILPLCLKSIVLRCSQAISPLRSRAAKVIVDEGHMAIFEPFVEMVTRGLMGEALTSLGSTGSEREYGLIRAMFSSDILLDFLIGLFSVLHPAHLSVLIAKYFKTMTDCEIEHLETSDGDIVFAWTEESLLRVQCARQLRIRAVERLAVLPNFIAINYPTKHSGHKASVRAKKSTWKMQYSDPKKEDPVEVLDFAQDDWDGLLPRNAWLADLLTRECLSICALSCEAVVAEAMSVIETLHDTPKASASKSSSLKNRPTASLQRDDLLMFQSIAIHAITCFHELLLRRHAMDTRFQKENIRGRIAALFTKPIIEKSLASVRWLTRMEATHKVRSLWLLCFVYVLQEAPETLIRDAVKSYCDPKDLRIHRFIRLLRLSSSTFQSFVDQPRHSTFPSEIDEGISPWLLQESFNTICATTIVVVEESVNSTSLSPREQKKMIQGILDLLLHVLTTPQSCVTHLRAVGGAIQALEKFGTAMFLEIAGGSLQHWIRVILSLMNSVALSVRSISVDFVVSLLGSAFDLLGNIDELALIFATLLPEVVAREIALNSVSGHVKNLEDVEKAVWPIRRSFADVEDTNPLDDDRVDPQLAPVLSVFCRACQAVIDGVLIELRLQGDDCVVVGTRMAKQEMKMYTFDADEESLFEAASFFAPETSPMQRIRWLMTLKSLHEAKGQWIEAAEALIMCARTISDSIPHLRHVWRPSKFALWSDSRRSLWLATVGEDMGHPERGNVQVVNFADKFLEPSDMLGAEAQPSASGRLAQPTVYGMCARLTTMAKEAVSFYQREEGVDELAYRRLESLLKILMGVLDDHGTIGFGGGSSGITRSVSLMGRKRYVEDEAALRRVLASLNGDMTKLAERLLLIVQHQPTSPISGKNETRPSSKSAKRPYYLRILMSGKKPVRFLESTTLPTFLEWNTPCICRVPKSIVEISLAKAAGDATILEEMMCSEFIKPIRHALQTPANENGQITIRAGSSGFQSPEPADSSTTCIDVSFVSSLDKNPRDDSTVWGQSKHFFYRRPKSFSEETPPHDSPASLVEMTVARTFPCALSRQRSLMTSEFLSMK